MKKQVKAFTLTFQRHEKFKGKIKVGLDANVLVDMILNELFYNEVFSSFKPSTLYFTHEICVIETIRTLINKKQFAEAEAKKKVKDLITDTRIKVIKRNKNNEAYAEKLLLQAISVGIPLHEPDNQILADFVSEGINVVCSENDHMIATCRRILRINTRWIAEQSRILHQALRRLAKSYRKRKRKR